MSYAPAIFIPGSRYRVKVDFKSGPVSVFGAGEVLTFENASYSHYDNCFVYAFRTDDGSAEKKEWWLPEGEHRGSWSRFFEPYGG